MTETYPEATESGDRKSALWYDIEKAINRHSRENESDTPDFVLADYILECLKAYEKAVRKREGLQSHD